MGESCCVKSIADLKALSGGAFRCVQLLGYYARAMAAAENSFGMQQPLSPTMAGPSLR